MAHTRVAQMKRYLDEHAAELEALPTGVVHFDIGVGPTVTAYVTRYDRLKRSATYLIPVLAGTLGEPR